MQCGAATLKADCKDVTKPVVTISPTSGAVAKSHTVTVTVTDDGT